MSDLPPGVRALPEETSGALPPGVRSLDEGGGDEEGPGYAESALRGAAQGATLNHADEIAGAMEALVDKIKGHHEDLGKLYIKHRDESRAAHAAAKEANPVTYGAGELGGSLATAAIPGIGEGGLLAQGAKMAALGAVGGEGASTADTAHGLLKDTAEGAALGGAAGVVGAGVGKLVGAGAHALADPLQSAADVATVKAAGPIGKGMVKLGDEAGIARTATTLRETGVVTPLTSVRTASRRLNALEESEQGKYGDAVRELAAKEPTSGSPMLTGNDIANHIEREVMTPLLNEPNRSKQAEGALQTIIDQYRERGSAPINIDEADRLLQGLQQRAKTGLAGSLQDAMAPGSNEAMAQAAKSSRRLLMQQAQNIDPTLAAARDEAGRKLAAIKPLANTAENRAQAMAGQSTPGLLGGQGIVGGIGLLAMGHPATGLAAIGAGLAQKGLRQYGNSLAGTGFNKLAAVARSAPQTLGKWGPLLAAAAARGDAALATLHYTLSQNDSEYASTARTALDAEPQGQ